MSMYEETASSPPDCKVCGGSGFIATKQTIDDGYGEVDSCPTCDPVTPPADVGADQQKEPSDVAYLLDLLAGDLCSGNRHEQYLDNCPVCMARRQRLQEAYRYDPAAGVADPPRQELRAYVDTLRRDADDAQRRGYPEAWSALYSAATGLSQLLDAITSSPTPGNSKS